MTLLCHLLNVYAFAVCLGEILSELISSVEESGAKYTVLYVSDPFRSIQYPSYRELARFLAEAGLNGSEDSTICDEVCQIKSSLLEGVLVVSFFAPYYMCSQILGLFARSMDLLCGVEQTCLQTNSILQLIIGYFMHQQYRKH